MRELIGILLAILILLTLIVLVSLRRNEPQIMFSRAYDEKKENRYDSAREAEERQLAEHQRLEEERVAREKEKAFSEGVKDLVKSRDEIEEIDWYRDRSTPMTNDQKNIHAYIGKKNDLVWLCFKMTYIGSDWLFVKSVLFKVDGEDFELHYGSFDNWNRDNSDRLIWEWKDVVVDAYTWRLINKIANSEKAMMRYKGQQYISDREISYDEKAALRTVISAYQRAGGQPTNR